MRGSEKVYASIREIGISEIRHKRIARQAGEWPTRKREEAGRGCPHAKVAVVPIGELPQRYAGLFTRGTLPQDNGLYVEKVWMSARLS